MIVKISTVYNDNILVVKNLKELLKKIDQKNEKCDYAVLIDECGCPSSIYFLYKNAYTCQQPVLEFSFISVEHEMEVDEVLDKPLIVINECNEIVGVIGEKEYIKFLIEQIDCTEKQLNQVETDLDAFMSCTDDLVCISDGSGSKVRVSSSCEKIYGIKSENLIGQNVKDLEERGMYAPSATRLVIEEKKQVSITQKTKPGRTLLVTAIPVFNDQGKIKRVVSISKDITDADKLKSELKQTKKLLQRYESELATHRIEAMKDWC